MSHKKAEEGFKATGNVFYTLIDQNGEVKETREIKNLVVTVGKNHVASVLAESPASTTFMPYIAIGTGTTGAVVGDTALQTESSRKIGAKSSSTNVWQNTVTFAAGEGTGAITEAGLFSAVSGGTMLCRQTFSPINKSATDLLIVTWQVTFA